MQNFSALISVLIKVTQDSSLVNCIMWDEDKDTDIQKEK